MKEEEIRPKKVFDDFLSLADKDIEAYFSGCNLVRRACPACGATGGFEFSKKGFFYALCPKCRTLFCDPIPEEKNFSRYYAESPSINSWATGLYKLTEAKRRESIYAPRARMLDEIITKHSPGIKSVVEIGAGFGTFAEEVAKLKKYEVYAIEPNKSLIKALQEKKLKVIPKFFEDVTQAELPRNGACYTSFELAEHLFAPRKFFKQIYDAMMPGDILIATTLNGMGLDLQVLWERSKSIYPPAHVNFFNTSSIRIMLEGIGFHMLEVRTPGKLDVDILSNNADSIQDRFWRNFIATATPGQKARMQEFIEKNGLSSHMMAIAQK